MALKVAVVIDPWSYPYNGTVVSTRRFVAALSDEVDFRLLAIGDRESALDSRISPFPQLSIPGFNGIIDGMKVPLANPWSRTVDVARVLAGVDLVHMQFPFFLGFDVVRQAKKMNLPILCSFHVQPENLLRNLGMTSPLLTRWLYRLFIWGLYQPADLVVTPSEFAAQLLIAHGLTTPTEVLSNGVPEEFLALTRKPGHSKLQLLSVGRLAPEKHQATILQAVAQSRFRDRLQLRLIGTGPLRAELEQRAKALNLEVQIGPTDDQTLLSCYQTADLFLHAGEIELEGMSVLEAMAAGNTVLVSNSRNSAATEFVPAESQFQHGDSVDLARKMDCLLGDRQVREAEGQRNRAIAGQRNHQSSVAQLLGIYQIVASRGRRENASD